MAAFVHELAVGEGTVAGGDGGPFGMLGGGRADGAGDGHGTSLGVWSGTTCCGAVEGAFEVLLLPGGLHEDQLDVIDGAPRAKMLRERCNKLMQVHALNLPGDTATERWLPTARTSSRRCVFATPDLGCMLLQRVSSPNRIESGFSGASHDDDPATENG